MTVSTNPRQNKDEDKCERMKWRNDTIYKNERKRGQVAGELLPSSVITGGQRRQIKYSLSKLKKGTKRKFKERQYYWHWAMGAGRRYVTQSSKSIDYRK